MDCRLQVFKQENSKNYTITYRFAVLDFSRSKTYPANYVCMLPKKIDQKGKGKILNVFVERFGDKSLDFAIGLLNQALKTEKEPEVKLEIEKRLKLIDPKQINIVKCCVCKKNFQITTTKRYKHNFCPECIPKKFGTKQLNPKIKA